MKVILDTNIWISFLLGKIGFQAIVNLFELIHAKCKVINGYSDKDLLVLKNHQNTLIITFAEFISMVQGLS